MTDTSLHQLQTDARTPFAVADAVVRAILRYDTELRDEDAVWSAFVSAQPGGDTLDREYIDAIRRTRHSIFYPQLQHLYEFGHARIGERDGADFCVLAGREFTETVIHDNIQPLLGIALARPGAFQETVLEMIRAHFNRWVGNRYTMAGTVEPDAVEISFTPIRPEQVAQGLRQAGLDPGRCFLNSARFVAGVLERYITRIVAEPDAGAFSCSIDGGAARLRLPVRRDGRFAYEALTGTLIGYIRQLEERQRAAVAEEQLERDLVIGSPGMRAVWERIRKASGSEEHVLLSGESGTGKSFFARKIHELSGRARGPFIAVGLTTLGSDNLIQDDLFGHVPGAFTGAVGHKEGLFSLANNGTIFLDEIGDASPELQAKLLRVIETRSFYRLGDDSKEIRVDVRILAATHRNLEAMVEAGTFRRDLYYRLNVISVHIPPLRERRDAVPALANFLLARAQDAPVPARRLAPHLADALKRYDWPGNIRELENAIKHALAMAEGALIVAADLPETVRRAVADGEGRGTEDRAAEEPSAPAVPVGDAPVIDREALRRAVRAADPRAVGSAARPEEIPAHIAHAKAVWLGVLIEECGGDLARIARFWDRSSEKTLRNLVNEYGLKSRLQEARKRRR